MVVASRWGVVPALVGVVASCIGSSGAPVTTPGEPGEPVPSDPPLADPAPAGDCREQTFSLGSAGASAFVVFDQQINQSTPGGDCKCYAPLFGASNIEGSGDRLGRLVREVAAPRLGLLAVPPIVGPFESKWTVEPACDDARIELSLGDHQASDVADALEAMESMQGGDLLVEALELAGETLSAEDGRSKTIVLYTILAAWCGRSGGVTREEHAATLEATIAGLRELGIETIVTGDTGASRGGLLDQMAVAGGSGHAYDLGQDEALLGERLRSLGQPACTFDLERSDVDPAAVEVTLDARAVPTEGFALVGQRLEIRGPWCEELRAGGVGELRVRFWCAESPE